MRRGKVQTNQYDVNVLVEHEDCPGHHYSHLDFEVMCEKMSDSEIDEEFSKLELTTKDKIEYLKKIKGFAVSNLYNKEKGFAQSDLFRYTKKRNK